MTETAQPTQKTFEQTAIWSAISEDRGSSEYSKLSKYVKVGVVAEHDSHNTRWPGPHKNVLSWIVLENGKAIGWNESPARGWAFPVLAYPKA